MCKYRKIKSKYERNLDMHYWHCRDLKTMFYSIITKGNCDGYSWLSTWLHMGLTKTQIELTTFNPDFFEVERSTFNVGQACCRYKGH